MESMPIDQIQPRYLWLDPSSGKKKQQVKAVRARSAIVVVGQSPDSRIWVLDSWADRCGTNEIVKNFVDLCERWGPIVAGFEDMGQQSLLEDPILQEAERRGLTIPLSPLPVPTKVEKNWRIRTTLQPIIGAGRLMLESSQIELKNEITNFPMSSVKDMIDALACACALIPPPQALNRDHDEIQEIAAYLRESGMPPRDIERRVAELGGYAQFDDVPNWQRRMSRMEHFAIRH